MVDILYAGKIYKFPTSWNELSSKQLVFVSNLLQKKIRKEAFDVLWFGYITRSSMQKIASNVSPYAFSEFGKHTEWIFERIDLIRNPFPILRIGLRKLYGQEQALSSLTTEQFFEWTEPAFRKYIAGGDLGYIDWLIAALYTEKPFVFESSKVKDMRRLIARISTAKKYAIFLFYLGSRNYIADRFSSLFSEQKGEKEEDPFDFLRMVEALAGGDISKNEAVRKTNLFETLIHIEEQKKQLENGKNTGTTMAGHI